MLAALASVSQAGKVIPAQKPVKDLAAAGLFELIEAKQVDVKLVNKNEASGNLLIENKSIRHSIFSCLKRLSASMC